MTKKRFEFFLESVISEHIVLFFCEYKRIQLIYWTYNFVSKELISSSVIRGLLYNFFLCPSKQPIHFFRSLLGRRKNGRGGGGGEREIEGERPRPLPISLPPNSLHLSTPAMQAFFFYFFSRKGGPGTDPGFFFRRGCTRLLLYFNTNKPHGFFFCRIPVVLDYRRSSQEGGGGVRSYCNLPLDPPLRAIGKELSSG